LVAKTTIYRIERERIERAPIEDAASVIRAGGLVAFPTETVYGLGADAFNPTAVSKIFEAKGRPADNPLIIHVAEPEDLYNLGRGLDWRGEALVERFWPGPLTLVVERSPDLPNITVAGLETAAIRMPRHAVALELIKASETPIAAPSANISGRPSPTTADHVIRDLVDKVDIVLDAGPTDIGVESTVLDLTTDPPLILRPGGVTLEELREAIGVVAIHPLARGEAKAIVEVARSPGMKYRHYSPRARVVVVVGEQEEIRLAVQRVVSYLRRVARVGVVGSGGHRYEADALRDLGPRDDPRRAARLLFKALRELDDEGVDMIVAEGWPEDGVGLAIMNRLRKAAGGLVIQARSVLEEGVDVKSLLQSEIMGT
jgi:L-threonylcarbamoyladenylate synthase